jgi:hypothetical protein
MKRGGEFLANRGFRLVLDDAVVIVGDRGGRLVFVPLTDGIGEREAYLLHASKGNRDEVTIAVLSFKPRRAYTGTGRATNIKVGYWGLQVEELWEPVVEEAYVVDEYGEIFYSEAVRSRWKQFIDCVTPNCGTCAVGCAFTGPAALKCFLLCCGVAAVTCAWGILTS